MNNPSKPSSALLTNEIERLTVELEQACADAALLRRLQDAEKKAVSIGLELAQAHEALPAAIANEANEGLVLEFANLRNVSVSVISPSKCDLSAITAQYVINFERRVYDARSRQSDWTPTSVNGFKAAPLEVLRYLVLYKPSVLPAIITDLAPGNPEEAMGIYMVALQRGYMTGPATV